MDAPVQLRPVEPQDEPFLFALYASTRAEELAPVPWSPEQKEAFLRWQFGLQSAHYREHYAEATFSVVVRGAAPAGRLIVHRGPSEIRVVDLALLPEHRGAGIGGGLLREVLDEGRRTGRRVTVHVEQTNRALRLYERLGFERLGVNGAYFLLGREP